MRTGNRITNTVALAALVIVGLTMGTVQAQTVHSFNMQGDPMSGDVAVANNPNGLQVTGETGSWALINTTTPAATDDGVTLTFGSGGTPLWQNTSGDNSIPMRKSGIRIGSHIAGVTDIPWTLTGLEPNASYTMIWYNKRGAPTTPGGENRHPNSGVTGFDAGNGIGASAPVDPDRDQNFVDVPADGSGTISGTWFLAGGEQDITAVAGVQVWKTVDPPAATPGTLIYGK